MVRVRIAPSPTGIPHIGNTRTALFNYLFAKHNKGKFIVRIEDTDRARIVPGAEEAIYEILEWLELKWDGEPYKQSEHLDEYREHADILLGKGLAYPDGSAIRFKMPKDGETSWDDLIGNKKIVFKNETQEDFIVIKSDGFPTYNFANVIDDHLMAITDVIRGEEFISSTPKHIQLYNAFDWKHPNFAHLPIVLGSDRAKLSKRHGAESILDYREKGYLKDALLNYMALLGWRFAGQMEDEERTPHVFPEREIMSLDLMIRFFELKDVNTASPIFDLQKLTWMNGEYIRMMTTRTLKNTLTDFYRDDLRITSILKGNSETVGLILGLAKTRMKTLSEFKDLVISKKAKLSPREKNIARITYEKFSSIENWNKEAILNSIREVLKENKIRGSVLYKIITGFEKGLPLPESLEIIGKKKTLEKIKSVID